MPPSPGPILSSSVIDLTGTYAGTAARRGCKRTRLRSIDAVTASASRSASG
jgi:hypothetical protein